MAKKKPSSKKTSGAKKAAPKRKPAGGGRSKAAPIGKGGSQVVTPAFTELVTRLRDAYLASVPKDARRKHARHIQMMLPPEQLEQEIDNEEAELSRQFEALPLGVVQFIWLFLHPEGRTLAFNLLFDEVTAEFTESHELDYGLRIGSKRFPELESLITPRPQGATDCGVCAGKGWSEDDKNWVTCEHCWGRGWFPPGLNELMERTAASLNSAGEDRDALVAAVRPFLDDGAALGFSASFMCAAFQMAVQLAGFDDEQCALRHRVCGTVAREHFPGGWPYVAESDEE
jgi:hypothetical protein